MKIYPAFDLKEQLYIDSPTRIETVHFKASTTVRKRHTDGLYYLIDVVSVAKVENTGEPFVNKARLEIINQMLFMAQEFVDKGIINPAFVDEFGRHVHQLDKTDLIEFLWEGKTYRLSKELLDKYTKFREQKIAEAYNQKLWPDGRKEG